MKSDGAARLLPCRRPKARAHELSRVRRGIPAIAVDDGDPGHSVLVYHNKVSRFRYGPRASMSVVLQGQLITKVA